MKVAIVTGIFPPDIGGPATHSADLADEMGRRGHAVTILTLWDGPRADRRPGLVRFPRRWPWPLRLAAVASWLLGHRREYEVVYATGLHPAAIAGRLVRRPVVSKVVGDPAWERARRRGLTDAGFEEFQRERPRSLRVRAMCRMRDWSLRRASLVTAPSAYLASVVDGWLGGPAGVAVIPNGVRVAGARPRRARQGSGLRAVFVGRLVAHKRVDVLIDAVAATAALSLDVVGDGPEREALESRAQSRGLGERVRFAGSTSHEDALRLMAGADVLVTASAYEGLPHVVIEALACGIPVVAAAVGGLPEVVEDGVNGLIVEAPTPEAFARALTRLSDDAALRRRLAARASSDSGRWRFDACVERLEIAFRSVLRGRPRAVFCGKGALPEQGAGDRLAILVRHLSPAIVTVGHRGPRRVGATRVVSFPRLRPRLLEGMVFYGIGPAAAVAMARRRGAVVCQSPYEGAGVVLATRLLPRRARPRIVVEVHGDWRAASRLAGGPARRVLRPASDRAARWALRRADRVRVVSAALEQQVRSSGYGGLIVRFVAYMDWAAFAGNSVRPVPSQPRAAYVGALQPYKGIDILLEAWRTILGRLPDAKLSVAGTGPMLADFRARVRALGLEPAVELLGTVGASEVAALLDRSSLLVLPSRSEGLGRVILEAYARGRPVVATRVGGIPELVEPGRTGLLVPPGDPEALAAALLELLGDPKRSALLGAEGRRRALQWDPRAEFEAGIEELARWIAEG